jgi:YaiO family outer membrane protein
MVSIIVFLFSFVCRAQQSSTDSLMNEARRLADAKEYEQAIQIIAGLRERYPVNADYTIWLGRLYSWKGDYEKGASCLIPLVKTEKASIEAFEALINIYTWSMQYDTAIVYTEEAIRRFPETSSLLLRKAFLLEKKGEDKKAMQLMNIIKGRLNHDNEYEALYTVLLRKKKNLISLSYLNTSFNNPGFDPWHFAFIEYKRDFKQAPVVARLNYGNLYHNSALQVEIESYPKITRNTYLFAQLGIADGRAVFPNIKAAFEVYTSLKHWTASLGSRFLNFKPDPVYIFSGHLGYQLNSWHFQYRPFLAETAEKWSLSHAISVKKTNELKESFIQLDFQYGVIPFAFFTTGDISRVKSARIGIQYRFRLAGRFFLQPAFMYEREEYYPELFRNRYNTQLSIGVRF